MNTEARRSLRHHRDALLTRSLSWVRRARRFQKGINLFCVLGGGLLATISGGAEGPMLASAGDGVLTMKGVGVIAGAVLIFIGSMLLFFLQDEAPALLEQAAALEAEAQGYLDERDGYRARIADAEALDQRRLAMIDAGRAMLEACENALLVCDLSLADAIDMTLRAGQRMLINAIDFDREEYWAISIFQVEGDELQRVVAIRPDPLQERAAGRTWKRGEGFAGMAWLRNTEVIIADCNVPEVATAYVVPEDKKMSTDPERYRSMAVIPIRVGPADEFWGAVAVSSDRVGRFRPDPGNERVKNVDTARLIARTVELMVAGFNRSNLQSLAELD